VAPNDFPSTETADKELKMTESLTWEKDLTRALDRATGKQLPVLLFFHNPD
jgi:hypothetical protein